MEAINNLWIEILGTISFATIICAFLKKFLTTQIKILWQHLKKKQKVYYFFCGMMAMCFVIYSIITVKTQVSFIQNKFDKYENLKKNILDGSIVFDYEKILTLLKKNTVNDFYILDTKQSKINFPNKKKWLSTHLTNIFGIIYINRKTKEVFFQYKTVVGKNKYNNETFYTEDYQKDNPDLFKRILEIRGADKEYFLSDYVDKCLNRPLKKNLLRMQKQSQDGSYIYNPCDFRESFFYTTGRIKGHEQKTFNEINFIYYLITPYQEEGDSKLFFYYSFNSDDSLFLDSDVHASLLDFLQKVNKYKEKIKNYENNSKSD